MPISTAFEPMPGKTTRMDANVTPGSPPPYAEGDVDPNGHLTVSLSLIHI